MCDEYYYIQAQRGLAEYHKIETDDHGNIMLIQEVRQSQNGL